MSNTMVFSFLIKAVAVVTSLSSFHLPVSAAYIPLTSPTVPEESKLEARADPYTSIIGPVVNSNFPDPAIIRVGGTSYVFATRDKYKPPQGRAHVQLATSTDGTTWTLTNQDAMPYVAGWETGNAVWAPDVVQLDNGKFVLYYTDEPTWATTKHCIGAALSDNVEGPFVPLDTVLICPDPNTIGGAIDPEGFKDQTTGKRYIIYKVDGNSVGHGGSCLNTVQPIVSTPIMLQEVESDGITLVGDPIQLLDRDDGDGPLIEAPSMHVTSYGTYFLFYSSGCTTTSGYNVKYATATNINGPFTKTGWLLATWPGLTGPGGLDIMANGDQVVFHGILSNSGATLIRSMYTTQLAFDGNTASIA